MPSVFDNIVPLEVVLGCCGRLLCQEISGVLHPPCYGISSLVHSIGPYGAASSVLFRGLSCVGVLVLRIDYGLRVATDVSGVIYCHSAHIKGGLGCIVSTWGRL